MPYHITWQVEKRVILLNIVGTFSDDELRRCSQEIRDSYFAGGTAPVHVICDVHGVEVFPHNLRTIMESSSTYLTHPAMGWFILVGFDSPLMRFLANTIMQILVRNFKHAYSLEEASGILCRVDSSVCGENATGAPA